MGFWTNQKPVFRSWDHSRPIRGQDTHLPSALHQSSLGSGSVLWTEIMSDTYWKAGFRISLLSKYLPPREGGQTVGFIMIEHWPDWMHCLASPGQSSSSPPCSAPLSWPACPAPRVHQGCGEARGPRDPGQECQNRFSTVHCTLYSYLDTLLGPDLGMVSLLVLILPNDLVILVFTICKIITTWGVK